MTEKQIEQMAEEYSEAFIAKGVAKASLIKGIKLGLKQHSHDYLVKTIKLKKKYEAQIEQLTYLHNEDVSTIKLLNKQIEKMKCCSNCRHSENDNKTTSICDECFEMCYWELRR